MGCLNVIVRHLLGDISALVRRVGKPSCTVERIGGTSVVMSRLYGDAIARVERQGWMTARVGLVCGTNLNRRPGILWASDGVLITLEGGYLKLIKR